MNVSPVNGDCISIFKKGSKPTRKEYTQVWIDLINQIENKNSRCAAGADEGKEESTGNMTGMADSDTAEE